MGQCVNMGDVTDTKCADLPKSKRTINNEHAHHDLGHI